MRTFAALSDRLQPHTFSIKTLYFRPVREQYKPLVDFMVVGAQKCGTTALWSYLNEHPQIGMSHPKEAHVFSASDYRPGQSPQDIDRRYSNSFTHCSGAEIRGEATPIYMYLPDIAAELKRYNSELKVIVMVRDPAERAISHYYMESARGKENLPLWLALLLEPWRLWRCADPRLKKSAYRVHSYRARGLYSFQLRNLYRQFSRDQVLVVSSHALLENHAAELRRIFGFLGVRQDVFLDKRKLMHGDQFGKRKHSIVYRMLHLTFLLEKKRSRGLYQP